MNTNLMMYIFQNYDKLYEKFAEWEVANMTEPLVRMFVDENGNYCLREDLNNDNNRFLCLTGVIMKITTHEEFTIALDKLKLDYFSSASIILHRREIIPAKPPFQILGDPEIRSRFNSDLLELINNTKFGIISIVIDKKMLVDRYGLIRAQDPYSLALEYLMQRYQYWMQAARKQIPTLTGDILAESRGKNEDKITKMTYTEIYDGRGYNPLLDANKYFTSREIKLKKKIANIAGLQLVDLVSHPARRYILSTNGLAPNIKKSSFEQAIVEILTESKFRKRNGVIEGNGAVLFPK